MILENHSCNLEPPEPNNFLIYKNYLLIHNLKDIYYINSDLLLESIPHNFPPSQLTHKYFQFH